MRKQLEAFCLILSVILGAGFMTGREIVIFFAAYGYVSLYFLPVLCLLFFYIFRKILESGKVIEEKLENKTISVMVFLLNVTLACSMFSALRELFFSFLPDITALVAFFLLALSTFLVCFGGVKRLVDVNLFLFPFMLVCILMLLGFGLFMKSESGFFFDLNIYNLPIFSALYAAFNLALSSVVVSKAGEGLSKRSITVLAGVASIVLCVIIGTGVIVICNNASEILLAEMPFFLLAQKIGLPMQVFMFVSIIFAGSTTLFSCIITLKSAMPLTKKSNLWSSLLICFITLIFSFVGFGNIIEVLYPVAGIIGAYLILSLVFEKPPKFSARNFQT